MMAREVPVDPRTIRGLDRVYDAGPLALGVIEDDDDARAKALAAYEQQCAWVECTLCQTLLNLGMWQCHDDLANLDAARVVLSHFEMAPPTTAPCPFSSKELLKCPQMSQCRAAGVTCVALPFPLSQELKAEILWAIAAKDVD